jgi:kinesin family protein 2/24
MQKKPVASIPPTNVGNPPKAERRNTLAEINRLQKERDERRKQVELFKKERILEEMKNKEEGTPGDVDFQRMIKKYRLEHDNHEKPHEIGDKEDKILICVRKRPISTKEIQRNDYDSVTCMNPVVVVHDCKLKVDGISKFLDSTSFEVDHTFHENNTTDEIYQYVISPLVPFVVNKRGRATVFAYGQTGSGKTYTMEGIQTLLVHDLYNMVSNDTIIQVTYYEIYGGRCQDLLNNRNKLNVREDGNGEVIVSDLYEVQASDAEELLSIIETGNRNRTTHATESNDVSSRSHAICQLLLNDSNGNIIGKISLIDLAGSERGADTKSHNRQLRMEGADINKSLLALKECIRALDSNNSHVPYRSSKLTLVLKDSFTRQQARTVMIAAVSPAASSADHTLNTLRYADRIKERVVGSNNLRNIPTPPAMQVKKSKGGVGSSPFTPSPIPPPNTKLQNEIDMDDKVMEEFNKTVEDLFEEEEELLNMHMNIIQENAELLTEEGRLLQAIQSDEHDIDTYAHRLGSILDRKMDLVKMYLLTHSLTYLLTHSLTHSLTYLITHSLTNLLTHYIQVKNKIERFPTKINSRRRNGK